MKVIDKGCESASEFQQINKNNSSDDDWGHSVRLALSMLSDEQCKNLSKRKNPTDPYSDEIQSTVNCPNATSGDPGVEVEDAVEVGESNDPKVILRAIHLLARQENSNLYAQIELLVKFDELKGWQESGSKSCAAWMNAYLQIDHRTAWERLRVGRRLRKLPVIRQLFKSNRLSWSKVRLLTRVAEIENEKMLAHASIDSTVSDVQRLCEEYKWPEHWDSESDNYKAKLQSERRALTWKQMPDGTTQIKLVLPPEQAQNFLHAIEQCEDIIHQDAMPYSELTANSQSFENDPVSQVKDDSIKNTIAPSQRRADAAVLLAERSIAFSGTHLSPADRFQVVVNIDQDSLMGDQERTDQSYGDLPTRKPMIEGIGAIPTNTARQIACDCSIIKLVTDKGEPLSIGRKQRIWTPPMRRAILTRDRHCQFPGCHSHRFLHIHHIKHWVDGGETSIENGVCLCHFHHQLVHRDNYTVERSTIETKDGVTTGLHSSSKKMLLPTRCRFVFKRNESTETKDKYADTHIENEPPRGGYAQNDASLKDKLKREQEQESIYKYIPAKQKINRCEEPINTYQYKLKLVERLGCHA